MTRKRYDETNCCEKCGGLASTYYDRIMDHMIRQCRRCGHRWTEAPLTPDPAPSLVSPQENVK